MIKQLYPQLTVEYKPREGEDVNNQQRKNKTMRNVILTVAAFLALASSVSAAYLNRPFGTFKKKGVLRIGDNNEHDAKTSQNLFEADNGCSGNIANAGTGSTVTGVTTTECGTGTEHQTIIEFSSAVLYTINNGVNMSGDNGNIGFLLYTFPANGIASIEDIRFDFELLASNGSLLTDTPDVGLGITDATGSNGDVLLSTITGAEGLLTGQTATGLNGQSLRAISLDVDTVIDTAAERTLYLNIADGFADTANGSTISAPTGFIQINWKDFGNLDD
jgi:hypothetical protein